MLADHKYLLIDIYNLLVDESKTYYLNFGFTDTEAKILAVFVVQTYGNHEDFKNYLIVNKDRFNLGRNCFLSKIKLKNPFHLFSIYSIVNKIVHFNLKLLVREIFMCFELMNHDSSTRLEPIKFSKSRF